MSGWSLLKLKKFQPSLTNFYHAAYKTIRTKSIDWTIIVKNVNRLLSLVSKTDTKFCISVNAPMIFFD